MLVLDNIATQDDYTPSLTLEQDTADTLTYVIGNASVYAQFRTVAHRGGADNPWGPSILLTPSNNTVRNVSGARFKSAVAGTPARVIAQLTGPQDPQLGAGTSFDRSISAAGAVGDVLTGTVFDYAGSAAPTGYLLCDGSAILRTDYAALFGVIGITYGNGDGSTTFNVPDLRGRVVVGLGTNADVSSRGNNDGVAVGFRRPKHRHTPHSHAEGASPPAAAPGGSATTAIVTRTATAPVDGGSGNPNDSLDAPAYLVLNKIIKT